MGSDAEAADTAGLIAAIEAYRDAHWDQIVGDMAELLAVASVDDREAGRPGAPFGPGPRQALDAALAIAGRLGFATGESEGYIGWADLPGQSPWQLGIIGHVDVVAAGPGWDFEPYGLTRKDGFLVGRGIVDDKGPLLLALHALRFWAQRGGLPFSVRVLMGCDEETAMDDVAHYRARFADPDFLFTPDGHFPLCYGEAGICHGLLESAPIQDGQIVRISGGQAPNAVAGEAEALVKGEVPPLDSRIEAFREGEGLTRLVAHGTSCHASLPHEGQSAIGLLVGHLCEQGVGNVAEQAFLGLLERLHQATDGSGVGIACADGHFGALTAVGSMIGLEDGRLRQVIDFRYPTCTSADQLARSLDELAGSIGGSFQVTHDKEPFLMDPQSPEVQALMDAFNAVTGSSARPDTSKGGTYARCFTAGACFGPEQPDPEPGPAWLGGLHSANEGVSEQWLRQCFTIYALAIGNLAARFGQEG